MKDIRECFKVLIHKRDMITLLTSENKRSHNLCLKTKSAGDRENRSLITPCAPGIAAEYIISQNCMHRLAS